MPQSEDIDWSFPVSVRDVVMTGRYGHLGFTRRPKRADHDAVDEARQARQGRPVGQALERLDQRKRRRMGRASRWGSSHFVFPRNCLGIAHSIT